MERWTRGRAGIFFSRFESATVDNRDRMRPIFIEGPVKRDPEERPGMSRMTYLSPFDHRGHLIAHSLGGPSRTRSGNVVPMHGLLNMRNGPYTEMEHEIYELLGEKDGWMQVGSIYERGPLIRPNAMLRPDAFHVRLFLPGGEIKDWFHHNFNPYIKEPGREDATAGDPPGALTEEIVVPEDD